eukprot:TRINITY_DN54737_c0_g1_i1.p1 TRINITY_DN54737_c0_g1~~TRINITY_DN54737_c0_g1_i1.p1  ORF type:complete len:638 (+),score=150.25 TRINITY_DN54737_c0_g1_i1:216-2129(+)
MARERSPSHWERIKRISQENTPEMVLPDMSRMYSAVRTRIYTTAQIDALKDLKFRHVTWLLQALGIVLAYYLMLMYWSNQWLRASNQNDPFSKVWVSAPLIFTVIYISFIRSFTRYMENRPPIESRVYEAMVVYNLYQIVINGWCCAAIYYEVRHVLEMDIWGNEHDKHPRSYKLGFFIWVHYNNKFVDMLDTVFIVIRKKYGQMTYLHYFQRIVLVWTWFYVCRYACGGDAYFGAMVHSGVSVFTYLYYFCRQIGVYFPWKSGVTYLHMLQCIICAAHSVFVLWKGNMPKVLALLQLATMLKMLMLFTNFQSGGDDTDPTPTGKHQARITVSFDSSGWLYLYHFGVAKFVEECMVPDMDHQLAFSGSSGGSLAACSLASHVDILSILKTIISCRHACRYNPFRMLPAAQLALDKHVPDDAHITSSNRLRVLSTRMKTGYPFVTAQVSSTFKTRQELLEALRASCHVPCIGGVLPYRTSKGWMYDGMFWSSALLIPWRTFRHDDELIKVSSFGVPGASIKPACHIPMWWALFPPDERTLRGMFDMGYRDAAIFFSKYQSGKLTSKARMLIDQTAANYGQDVSESVVHFLIEVQNAWLQAFLVLSLIHISEPTRLLSISYAVFCLKKKKNSNLRPYAA